MPKTPKIQKTDISPYIFLDEWKDEKQKQDAYKILEYMSDLTGETPVMWWEYIIGFWEYYYTTTSGEETSSMCIGFTPSTHTIHIYVSPDENNFYGLLEELWRYKAWKSSITIRSLSDINWDVLEEIIRMAWDNMVEKYQAEK